MKINKKILLITMMLVLAFSLTGCRKPYDEPEFVTIEPSQTAFLIPLVGDTGSQSAFDSEELLAEAKVGTKEVQIPHRWVQTGRMSWDGEYRDSARLILVERKPVTREWTAGSNTGTSSSNQGIMAESKGSISFSVSMNVSAQIDESDATKFLYRYNNKSLSSVMDTDIRAMIESEFVEECASREMSEILDQKKEIMNTIRTKVKDEFAEKGITITVLGLKGDVVYADPNIQKAINKEFTALKDQEAQVILNKTKIEKAQADAEANKLAQETENEMNVAKAKADAEVIKLQASTLESRIKLEQLEIQKTIAKQWKGDVPQFVTGENTINVLDMLGRTK